jgi:asparagine synthetase B (glutamine-hydrolysing)
MPSLDSSLHVRLRHGVPDTRGEVRFFRGHLLPRGAAAEPDGIFAAWQWDGQRVTVRNDRYGVAPLFYWHDDEQFGVSPSVLALIQQGAPTTIDETALGTFLRLGFLLGDDTPFRAIRAVPPNAVLTWENGKVSVSGGRPRPLRNPANRDQAIDGFVTLFRQAIRRRPPDGDGTFVPLSGGRDSRHILFELCALGHRPRCVTIPRYPPRPGEDERIAPLVARACGVPHATLPRQASRCSAEVLKNWATHLCADEHAWYLEMIACLGDEPVVMYDGLGGALSVPSRFLNRESIALIEDGRSGDLADRVLRAYSIHTEPYLHRVLRPELHGLSRERVVERMAAELDEHADAPDPIKSFNFWNRIRRELALVPYGMMKHVPTVYTPYLDHDVFDFLMGMPPTVMSPGLSPSDKSFHTEAIHRAFPNYAAVSFEDKAAPKLDARAHDGRFVTEAAKFIVRHAHAATRVLHRPYVLPRALYAAVNPSFGQTRAWFGAIGLYLTQLEMAAGRNLPESIDVAVPHVQRP